ncbi:protein adenylyltransferase SelO family protein [Corynebacterium endometrii]|uniref:Protein nucleotidyltransferase YdiU n=1 Tax=Corynebacterium endometrii TaxID=2488819 RepID=A0A4P7QGF8_9CORY|nr:protein adenylyltransferase SelO family protein [Corynebacterium endometrii]QCB28683.1 hypothetical protein CENDO_07045 [Corynebacterium endometrii]
MNLPFDLLDDYASSLPFMVRTTAPEPQPEPSVAIINEPLAQELGLSPEWLRSEEGTSFLLGHGNPSDQPPQAMAYSGHQFGQFNPYMGDGRAALLGEIHTPRGLIDIHTKGSGLTPWSRPGSDGRGTLSSMLREYLISEALYGLGIPTTRSLAVITTGRRIQRTRVEPSAVLVRTAASHIRVGTFQYAALTGGETATKALADYAIARHYPELEGLTGPEKYREFFLAVMKRQCHTVALWQSKGFIHGVMNTDNTSISGESIDFGPCAFMEQYSPSTVFSSIDTGGRYAYGNQPGILGWNLTRLLETLLPLLHSAPDKALDTAQEIIAIFPAHYEQAFTAVTARGFGISPQHPEAQSLTRAYTEALEEHAPDITITNRALVDAAQGDYSRLKRLLPGSAFPSALKAAKPSPEGLDRFHPLTIPRNKPLDFALSNASDGFTDAFDDILTSVQSPFAPPLIQELATPDPDGLAGFRTFCGT